MFAPKLIILLSVIGSIKAQDPVLSISPATLPTACFAIAAVYDGDDAIYLLGGHNGTLLDNILKFTISLERIDDVAVLPEGRREGSAIWDGTGVVYFGGFTVGSINSIRRYVPGNSVTHAAETLPIANFASSIITTSNYGEALIFGGLGNGKRIVKYSKNLATEITDSRLPMEVYGSSAIHYSNANEDSAYIFGGYNGGYLDSIIQYNIRNGESSVLPQALPYPAIYTSSVYNGTYAYIIGGFSTANYTTGVIRFNPLTKEVSALNVNNFPDKLELAASVFVEKLNRAYIFGGYSSGALRNQIMYLSF